MTPDRDDPILDACLDEVLGGRTPPDLSPQILQALAAHHGSTAWDVEEDAKPQAQFSPPDVAEQSPEPPPVVMPALRDRGGKVDMPQVALPQPTIHRPRAADHRSRRWLLAVAGGLLGLAATAGIVAALRSTHSSLANNKDAGKQPQQQARHTSQPGELQKDVASPLVTPPKAATVSDAEPPQLAVTDNRPANEPEKAAAPAPQSKPEPVIAFGPPPPRKKHPAPSSEAQIVSFVNAELAKTWQEAKIKPAPPLDDAAWCQRVYQTVLGRLPTPEEQKALAADTKQPGNRERLVARLLGDSVNADEYAVHWAAQWLNVLLGRGGGAMVSRDDFAGYLRESLRENKPYDHLAFELLTASGSGKAGSDDYNPAVNFLLAAYDPTATRTTARVSRVLLGHQLQCAQCHAHPTNGSSQEQFWSLSAFFRQMKVEQQGGVARLVNVDFAGQRRGSHDGEVYYETSDGLMKTAFPRFLDGTRIPASGDLATVNRRRELARLVAQSDDLPRAAVNRLWAQVFGYGFVRPVDDLGPNASASQPAVFERLTSEFVAHDYDFKRLLRWTLLSEAFTRSANFTDLATKDMPEEGEPALFSRDYRRPPSAAGIVRSLAQAASIRRSAPSDRDVKKARVDWLAQFNRAPKAGPSKAGKVLPPVGKQAPALLATGGPIHRAATSQESALVKRIAASKLAFEEKVGHLFLAAVSREPNRREQTAAAELLQSAGGNQAAALEDIWWALASSNECTLDR
jgi:hypothetical protein